MYKQFLFLSVLTVVVASMVGSQAEASRARLISLGQATNTYTSAWGTSVWNGMSNLALGQAGTSSIYIDDHRSIFMNPAFLTKYAPFADFEMGTNTSTPTTATPNAEGGLFLSSGEVKWGLQLGRESTASSFIQGTNALLGLSAINTAGTGTAIATPESTVDFVVAGGSGTKWGAGLLYGSSEFKTEAAAAAARFPNYKASTLEARGGVLHDKLSAYGKLLLMWNGENEQASGSANKLDGKPSVEGGAAFDLNADQKVWGTLGYYTGNARVIATGTTDREASLTFLSGGFTQFMSPEAGTRLFMSAGLTVANSKVAGTGAVADAKQERLYIPIVIGLENQTYDWMALRASVRQNVMIDQTKYQNVTDSNSPNSTSVAVGPGFKWKRLLADAVLGASTTGTVNSTALLMNGSLTYTF